MNLLNGVFSKSSAFSKVQRDPRFEERNHKSGSFDLSNNLKSCSSNPSLDDRRSFNVSAERHSSSSERDMSLTSEEARSLERPVFSSASPVLSMPHYTQKQRFIKPVNNSQFPFMSSSINNMKGFGISPSFYWMKYQYMMKHPSVVGTQSVKPDLSPVKSHTFESNSSMDSEVGERMIGRLTASERKVKVDRYLQKKRCKSKMVRYQ